MSFYEIQFPDNISYGSSGGPGFATTIVGLDTGAEQRVSRWSKARRKYDVSYGVKTYQDLQDVLAFYMSVKGSAFGFRYKDWLDFTTASDGRSAYNGQDVAVYTNSTGGATSGTTEVQLTKRYSSTNLDGSTTPAVIRNITKPVLNKVSIAIKLTSGSWGVPPSFTVNTATGVLTIAAGIADGATIYAGCEFDVPVRFAKEVDDLLSVTLETFDSGNTDTIELIEIVEHGEHNDEYFYGGSTTLTITGDATLAPSQGRVIVLVPNSASHTLTLPDPWSMQPGGPHFYLVNGSTNAIALRDARGELSAGDGHASTSSAKLNVSLPGSASAGSTATMWINEFADGSRQWWVWSSSQ
jgi:uncharacterized protein (TIGR02217 family)